MKKERRVSPPHGGSLSLHDALKYSKPPYTDGYSRQKNRIRTDGEDVAKGAEASSHESGRALPSTGPFPPDGRSDRAGSQIPLARAR